MSHRSSARAPRPGIIQRGEFLKYLEAVGYHARTRGLTTMLWDAGQFLDRSTLTWRDPGVHAMMRASWTDRSGTASSDEVYLPRTGAVTDRTLTLNLNGTRFQGLRHGITVLTRGTDYTLDGDRLTLTAAMEARYEDGSNAGPASWTSYKEFWSTFRPDTTAGTIVLTPEFFAEVADGRVTLTFHFRSGAQVTYVITRTGTSVTGAPA